VKDSEKRFLKHQRTLCNEIIDVSEKKIQANSDENNTLKLKIEAQKKKIEEIDERLKEGETNE
tara:strand:+ start:519 stop:707 length:189 start_codon:yes stop_codon:yes gene_type:complete